MKHRQHITQDKPSPALATTARHRAAFAVMLAGKPAALVLLMTARAWLRRMFRSMQTQSLVNYIRQIAIPDPCRQLAREELLNRTDEELCR